MDSPTFRFVLGHGFWLGAWAWDTVSDELRAAAHEVTAVALPGPGSEAEDRSTARMEDHIAASAGVLAATPAPAALVLHSGAGVSGCAATDRVPVPV